MKKLVVMLLALIGADAMMQATISVYIENKTNEAVTVNVYCKPSSDATLLTQATIQKGGSHEFTRLGTCKEGYQFVAGSGKLLIKTDPRKAIETRKTLEITGAGDELTLEEQK